MQGPGPIVTLFRSNNHTHYSLASCDQYQKSKLRINLRSKKLYQNIFVAFLFFADCISKFNCWTSTIILINKCDILCCFKKWMTTLWTNNLFQLQCNKIVESQYLQNNVLLLSLAQPDVTDMVLQSSVFHSFFSQRAVFPLHYRLNNTWWSFYRNQLLS